MHAKYRDSNGYWNYYICDGSIGTEVTKPHEEFVWENEQCGGNSSWYFHNLTSSTTDILMRICRHQNRADEYLAIIIWNSMSYNFYTSLHIIFAQYYYSKYFFTFVSR